MRRESSRMTVGRQLALQAAHRFAHRVGDVDRVRARDLEHLERDGRGEAGRIADLGRGASLGGAVDHGGHVADANRGAVAHGDGDVGERGWIDDAARDAHEPLGGAALDAAGGHFLVFALKRGRELRRRQPIGVEGDRVDLDADLARVAADHVHAAHSLDRLDARLHDLDGQVGDLADGPLTRSERDRHDRLLVGRQLPADARHLGLHVLLRDGDVDAEIELEADDRDAFERGGGDLLDPLHGVQRFLDRLGDLAHHHFRRGAGVRRLRDDDRVGDVGVLVDRQALVADDAEHDERHHHHGGEDGPLDRDV